MKRWIVIIALALAALGSSLRAETVGMDPGMESRLRAADDTSRLKLLYEQTLNRDHSAEQRIFYIDRLLEEARLQHNVKYRCEAYLARIHLVYNRYQLEEVNRWMDSLEPLARREKFYDCLFLAKRCELNVLIFQEQYEKQERAVKQMLEEARSLDNITGLFIGYECLSYSYSYTFRNDKALEALETGYQLAPRCQDKLLVVELLRPLVNLCEEMQDSAKLKKYLHAQETLLKTLIKEDPQGGARYGNDMLLTYLSYLRYYSSIGDRERAEEALRQADRYYSDKYGSIYTQRYHFSRGYYYISIQEWEKALSDIDAGLAIMDVVGDLAYYQELANKAYVLAQAGREKEAVALYQEVSAAKDSLQIAVLNKQANQIKSSYDADRLLLEKETIQRQAQLSLLLTLCILIVVLAYFIVHILRVGKKLHRDEAEMSQMAREVELANQAKAKFLASISSSIRVPLDEIVGNSLILSSDDPIELEQKKRLSDSITGTAQRLMTMVNDILVLSKLEAGVMKLSVENLDVLVYLHSMTETLAFERKATITVDFPADREYEIRVDVNYFSQMMSGLLTERAEGCEALSLGAREVAPGWLQLSVCGTALATRLQTQENAIRNEINRMLTARFCGRYEIHRAGSAPCVHIVLPVHVVK